jgi:hypothetical protein
LSDGHSEHSRIVLPQETGEQPSLSSGLSDAPWLNRRRPGSLYSIIEYDKSSSSSSSSSNTVRPGISWISQCFICPYTLWRARSRQFQRGHGPEQNMGGLFRSIAWAATAIALLAPAESLETCSIRERIWCSHGRCRPALGFATSTSVRVLGAAGRVCRRGSICGHVPHGRLGRPRLLGLRAQVDPRLPPDDAAAQQDPDAEQSGGIDWDAVGMQWKRFQKMYVYTYLLRCAMRGFYGAPGEIFYFLKTVT